MARNDGLIDMNAYRYVYSESIDDCVFTIVELSDMDDNLLVVTLFIWADEHGYFNVFGTYDQFEKFRHSVPWARRVSFENKSFDDGQDSLDRYLQRVTFDEVNGLIGNESVVQSKAVIENESVEVDGSLPLPLQAINYGELFPMNNQSGFF